MHRRGRRDCKRAQGIENSGSEIESSTEQVIAETSNLF